ncbi:MAG: rRNA maturation RNase YbeY [Holophagales bacterium]|nr:rRNA maturation RNase YbeY [Holophagales bacterium]
MDATCEISIQNPCRYPEGAARRWRPWLESVVAQVAPRARSLAVRFVSDREMRRLNLTFRRQDATTDVLSFPADLEGEAEGGAVVRETLPDWPEVGDPPHLGDIVISVPTARRQAARQEHRTERELRTLLLHGLLHCLGHDHEVDDGRMEKEERVLRRRWLDHAPPTAGAAP